MTKPVVVSVLGYAEQFGWMWCEPFEGLFRVVTVSLLREDDERTSDAPDLRLTVPLSRPLFLHRRLRTRRLRHVLRAAGVEPRLLHGNFYSSLAVLRPAAVAPRAVLTEHSNLFGRISSPYWPDRSAHQRAVKAARRVYRGVDRVLAVSSAQAEQLARVTGIDHVSVVPNFAAGRFFEAGSGRDSESHPNELRLLTVGRLDPTKDKEVAIEAVAHLRQRGIDASLDVVGDGPLRQRLEALVSALGIGAWVRFPGRVSREEVVALMARADVLLSPSNVESFGLPVVEAMAAGLPVVSTPVGVAADLEDSGAIELIDFRDPVELAGGALRAAADRHRVERARAVARERFSLEAVRRRLEAVVAEVL